MRTHDGCSEATSKLITVVASTDIQSLLQLSTILGSLKRMEIKWRIRNLQKRSHEQNVMHKPIPDNWKYGNSMLVNQR